MALAPEPVAIDRPATATVVTLRLPDSVVGVEVGLQPGDGGRVGADQGQGVVVGERGASIAVVPPPLLVMLMVAASAVVTVSVPVLLGVDVALERGDGVIGDAGQRQGVVVVERGGVDQRWCRALPVPASATEMSLEPVVMVLLEPVASVATVTVSTPLSAAGVEVAGGQRDGGGVVAGQGQGLIVGQRLGVDGVAARAGGDRQAGDRDGGDVEAAATARSASRLACSPVTVVGSEPIRVRVWLSASAVASIAVVPPPLLVMLMVAASAVVTPSVPVLRGVDVALERGDGVIGRCRSASAVCRRRAPAATRMLSALPVPASAIEMSLLPVVMVLLEAVASVATVTVSTPLSALASRSPAASVTVAASLPVRVRV